MTCMDKAKPFCIPKREVWEAYKQVKANQGAAGVDGETLEDFERDLKGNLYRIWNRMSSGSYVPPPVRRVDIPKGDTGGTRPLGVPTVSDRIAQMVVKRYLEPIQGSRVNPQPSPHFSYSEINALPLNGQQAVTAISALWLRRSTAFRWLQQPIGRHLRVFRRNVGFGENHLHALISML